MSMSKHSVLLLCVAQFPGVTAISKSDIYIYTHTLLNSDVSSDSRPSLCIKMQAQEIQEKPTGSNS